jgi:hypothetical protein
VAELTNFTIKVKRPATRKAIVFDVFSFHWESVRSSFCNYHLIALAFFSTLVAVQALAVCLYHVLDICGWGQT